VLEVLKISGPLFCDRIPTVLSACLGEGQGRQSFVRFGERTEAFELVKNNKLFNEKISTNKSCLMNTDSTMLRLY